MPSPSFVFLKDASGSASVEELNSESSSGSEIEHGAGDTLPKQMKEDTTAAAATGLSKINLGFTHVDQMINFLHHGIDRDVKFIFTKDQDTVIMAHKSILCARSLYFADLFSKDKKLNEFTIEDANFSDFDKFLQHLYAGHPVTDVKDAFPLLKLSATYKIPDINVQCTELLKKGITDENALLILDQSGKYEDQSLNLKAFEYITAHASRIVERLEFVFLSKENLKRLIAYDALGSITELGVFEAIIRWGLALMKRQGVSEITEKRLRSVLDDVVPLIRFPLMTKNEFYLKVLQGDLRILTPDEKEEMRDYFNVDETDRNLIKLRIFNSRPRTRPMKFLTTAFGDIKEQIVAAMTPSIPNPMFSNAATNLPSGSAFSFGAKVENTEPAFAREPFTSRRRLK